MDDLKLPKKGELVLYCEHSDSRVYKIFQITRPGGFLRMRMATNNWTAKYMALCLDCTKEHAANPEMAVVSEKKSRVNESYI